MNLKRELEKMKKEDLQLIFKEIYNKMTQKNKKEIIKLLLKPLSKKYRKILRNCERCKKLHLPKKDKSCKDCKAQEEFEQTQRELEQPQETFEYVNTPGFFGTLKDKEHINKDV